LDNVQIEILDSANNIEGVLEVGDVKNFPLSLTNSIAELVDINKSNGSYSVPFKIPSTKDNDDLLDHIYLSQQKNYKDIDAEKDCRIIVNGLNIDNGRLKITRIKRVGQSGNNYSFTFFGENMDWALQMRGKTTQDLPYLDNTYTYDTTTQIASWSNVGGSEQPVFSLINRGVRLQSNVVNVGDLYPDYFALDYLNNAFKSVGYNFDSTHFNQTTEKQLIIPFFGNNFRDEARQEDEKAVVKMDSSATNFDNSFTVGGTAFNTADKIKFYGKLLNYQGLTFPTGLVDDFLTENKVADYIETPLPLKDDGNNFASNQYVVPYATDYRAAGTIEHTLTYNPTENWNTYNIDYKVKVTRGSSVFYIIAYLSNKVTTTNVLSASRSEDVTVATFKTNNFALQAGDILELSYFFSVKAVSNLATTSWYFKLEHESHPILFKPTAEIKEGEVFNWKDVSDDKISMLDIVSDIGKTANIIWRVNKRNKTVYAEPRDDFYNALNTATNYTDRIDENNQIELTYNSLYYKQGHKFSYKEDGNDKYLKKRNEDVGDDWLSYEHSYPTKFKSGTTKLETKEIAATYTIEDINGGGSYPFFTARLWNDETSPTASTVFKPRLLYFNYAVQSTLDSNTPSFQYSTESSQRATIPYALPFSIIQDGVTLAGVDGVLSFKDTETENGIWSNHYSLTSREIIEGKRAKVNFTFDLVDYNELDFRKIIYIDNRYPELEGYWRIDKVNGFKPAGGKKSTKFELSQAKNYEPLARFPLGPISTEIGDDPINGGYNLNYGNGVDTIGGNSRVYSSTNYGVNNTVADDSNTVIGNNLRVSGGGVTAYGMYNADVSSDLLQFGVGTNENNTRTLIRVDEDGNVYFNGSLLNENGDGTVVTVTSDITADENVDTYLVDTTSDITITFEEPTTLGKTWNCKKINASNTMTLLGGSDGSGGVLEVDGDVTGASATSLNDNLPIQWCGETEQFKIL
jgi:hypothetical protein